MKDGRIIKGKIVNFSGGRFTVMFDDGTRQRQMVYSADEVESISFDPTTRVADSMRVSEPSSVITTTDENNTIITVAQNGRTTNPQTTSPKSKQPSPTPAAEIPGIPSQPVFKPTPEPIPEPTPEPTPKTTVATQENTPIMPKPIEIKVKVLADNTSNGWTNSGWVVRQGQKIKIVGSGRISLGNGRMSTPGGIASATDDAKLIKTQPTGGLIAVIGDDNNDFIFVGNTVEFTASRDGALFLGVNESNLDDNIGAFDVKVEIFPEIVN